MMYSVFILMLMWEKLIYVDQNEVMEETKVMIDEKNPTLSIKEAVAKQVGVGAVIFNDLKNNRLNDIEFSLDDMLNFEGETGPYIQYTYARTQSILSKSPSGIEAKPFTDLGESARPVIRILQEFPLTVEHAYEQADPSIVAKYGLQLARSFNKYDAHNKILHKDERLQNRLALCQSVSIVMKESMRLLGINIPIEM